MRSLGSLVLILAVPACAAGTITGEGEPEDEGAPSDVTGDPAGPGADDPGSPPSPAVTGARVSYAWGGCMVNGYAGECIDTDYEGCYGDLYAGAGCPGGSNILCCVDAYSSSYDPWASWGGWGGSYGSGYSCSAGGYSGVCIDTSYEGCSGSLYAGACPGGGGVLCCVDDSYYDPYSDPYSDPYYDPYGGWYDPYGGGYDSCASYGGSCIDTNYEYCGGSLYSGLCGGGGSILCCAW